ncbi:MAG: hypothetical protein HZA35_00885 [Parcubacteria group bacterium]|nr:hypothetical protein [Parcubacteria group bacterium]
MSIPNIIKIDRTKPFDPEIFIGKEWGFWKGPIDGNGLERLIGKRDDDLRQRFGDTLTVERIVEETSKMYHIYFLIPVGAAGGHDKDMYRRWVGLLGQRNVIRVSDPAVICEVIATVIAREKGVIESDVSNVDVLRKLGFDTKKARLVAHSFG